MRKRSSLLAFLLVALAAQARADYNTSADRAGPVAATGIPGDEHPSGATNAACIVLLDIPSDPMSSGLAWTARTILVPDRLLDEPCPQTLGRATLQFGPGAASSSWMPEPMLAYAPVQIATTDGTSGSGTFAPRPGSSDVPDVIPNLSLTSDGSRPGDLLDHRGPASITMLATGLASVGLTMQLARSRRRAAHGVHTRRHSEGPERLGRDRVPRASLERTLGWSGEVPDSPVPINLRITRAELAALERLRDACEYPDGSFDEARATAGIRRILGDEVVAFLCSGIAIGDRRTVKLSVHDNPVR